MFRPTDLSDNLDWIVRKYGEPLTYGLHSAVLGDVPEAGVSILMSGQHGMLFPSEHDAWALRYRRQPALVKRCLRAALPFLRHLNTTARPGLLWRVYEVAGDAADELEAVIDCASSGLPASLRGIILPQQFRDAYYSDPTWTAEARQASAALFASVANDCVNESDQDKITFLHRHFRVAEGSLLWNCVWGRAYGIKIRVPFFDNEFSDFVLRLHRKSPNKRSFVILQRA